MPIKERVFNLFLTITIMAIVSLVLFFPLRDYVRTSDLMTYRIAYNFANGHGIVFNPTENVWPTLSPLWSILLGGMIGIIELLGAIINPEVIQVPQSFYVWFASALTAAIYGLLASSIFYWLRAENYSLLQIGIVIGLFIAAHPVWLGMRSAVPLALLFVMNALHAAKSERYSLSGFLAGIAILAHPTAIIGGILLGLYLFQQKSSWRYWRVIWLPLALWIAYAALTYDVLLDGLLAHRQFVIGDYAQALIWSGLLLGFTWTSLRSSWLAILATWAVLEIALAVLIIGDVPTIESPILALVGSIILGQWIIQRQWQAFPALAVWFGVYLLFPIQTEAALKTDLALSKTIYIPERADLLHDRSDMIIYHQDDFTDNIYRFDGTHSPFILTETEFGNYESIVIALAPEFIYVNEKTLENLALDLRSDTLSPLRYRREIDVQLDPGQREGDQLWFRDRSVGELGDTINLNITINPDIRLKSYALDRSRLAPNEPLRLRLDWELVDDYPRYPIGLQISLLDIEGIPLVTVFPSYEARTWARNQFSTYHALLIPSEAQPQVVRIGVAVDYRAAIVGSAEIGNVVIRSTETPPEQFIGRISEAILYDVDITLNNDSLTTTLLWGIRAPLKRDYQVFVHLIPVGEVQPVATGDSAPLGGRFPTSYWHPDEVVFDPHTLSLADVPAGQYELKVGFYVLETFERLRDENGDNLTIAQITIDESGEIRIEPN